MEEFEKIALGALLHDIGKVIQRTIGKMEGDHSTLGYDFLKSFPEGEEISLFAKYHHEKEMENIPMDLPQRTKNLLWIVYEADNLSSKERGKMKGEFNPKNPLISVFSSITFNRNSISKKAYPLTRLDFNHFVFPAYEIDRAEDRITHKAYTKILQDFKSKFLLISLDLMLTFLEKEATFIPARTGEDEDISLFDHLKTTCAIASCIYYYHKDELDKDLEKEIKNRATQKYLLVSGDISGIQKFIYNITSKGALRLLRARSFLLEIISEDFIQQLLDELHLSRANLLYNGGGHFYILAPNREETKEKIKELKRELNRWLLESFEGNIYYAIDYIEFTGEKFEDFSEIWVEISKKVNEDKSRKFRDILVSNPEKLLREDYNDERYYEKELCIACKKYVYPRNLKEIEKNEEKLKYCKLCDTLLKFGHDLARDKKSYNKKFYILRYSKDKELNDNFLELAFSKVIIKDEIIDDNFNTLFQLNDFDIDARIIELKKGKKFTFSSLAVANYIYQFGDLDVLAKESKGINKVGVLRMDVDNLGSIFQRGLPEDKRTISRITTLSRFLNYFFKGYLNLLGEFEERNVVGITNNIWKVNGKIIRVNKRIEKRKFVIVYAGGDDLLIIGSWDDVFELALDINSLFRKYVGDNENITISAGFSIFDMKFPFYKMAEISGEKEKIAKYEGKNRIWVFERGVKEEDKKNYPKLKESVEWKKISEIWQDFAFLLNGNKLRVNKAHLGKLFAINNSYKENMNKIGWAIQLSYWYGRLNENEKNLFKKIVGKYSRINREQPSEIYWIDIPVRILDLATRGE